MTLPAQASVKVGRVRKAVNSGVDLRGEPLMHKEDSIGKIAR